MIPVVAGGADSLSAPTLRNPLRAGNSDAKNHPYGVLSGVPELWSAKAIWSAKAVGNAKARGRLTGGRGASWPQGLLVPGFRNQPGLQLFAPVPAVRGDVVGSRALHLALLGQLPAQHRELLGNPGLLGGNGTLLGSLFGNGPQRL
jgi:hypothetical protein